MMCLAQTRNRWIPDDASDDSISGPTDKEDESDAHMVAQTDDDDNDDIMIMAMARVLVMNF